MRPVGRLVGLRAALAHDSADVGPAIDDERLEGPATLLEAVQPRNEPQVDPGLEDCERQRPRSRTRERREWRQHGGGRSLTARKRILRFGLEPDARDRRRHGPRGRRPPAPLMPSDRMSFELATSFGVDVLAASECSRHLGDACLDCPHERSRTRGTGRHHGAFAPAVPCEAFATARRPPHWSGRLRVG